jgi:hypothetical protein
MGNIDIWGKYEEFIVLPGHIPPSWFPDRSFFIFVFYLGVINRCISKAVHDKFVLLLRSLLAALIKLGICKSFQVHDKFVLLWEVCWRYNKLSGVCKFSFMISLTLRSLLAAIIKLSGVCGLRLHVSWLLRICYIIKTVRGMQVSLMMLSYFEKFVDGNNKTVTGVCKISFIQIIVHMAFPNLFRQKYIRW